MEDREGKMKQDGIRREMKHKRLLISKQTESCWGVGGEGQGGWVMDTGEGMCYGECCEM